MPIVETTINFTSDYTDWADFQYNIKNNSITAYSNHADFRDCVENSFITNYADYVDIQYYMKNNSITDCANYANFEYQIYLYQWLRRLSRRHTAHKK